MTTTPVLIWAQRAEWVYVKIELQDVKEEKITVTPEGKFEFSGKAAGRSYHTEVQLFGELDIAVRVVDVRVARCAICAVASFERRRRSLCAKRRVIVARTARAAFFRALLGARARLLRSARSVVALAHAHALHGRHTHALSGLWTSLV